MTTYTSAPTLDKSAIKDKYAYALMPTIPPGATSLPAGGKEAASILSGDNVVVADYSQNKDLAFQFVKMLTDQDIQDGVLQDLRQPSGQRPVGGRPEVGPEARRVH